LDKTKNKPSLQSSKAFEIPIFLEQEDFKLTMEYLEKNDKDFVRNLDTYYRELSEVTPSTFGSLLYEVPYGRTFAKIIFWRAFFSNILSLPIKNLPHVSKRRYEELSKLMPEISLDLRPILQLRSSQPILTTIWNQHFDVARSFKAAFDKIKTVNILEFGVGEGIVPFSMALLFPDYFSKLKWTGFDFAFNRVLRADRLFRNHSSTKSLKNYSFYNGDAKNVIHEDKSFDVAISHCVLEQIKMGKKQALNEMARVAKYVVVREPIYEHQTIFGKAHFRKNDYVLLHMSDFENIGDIVYTEKHTFASPTYAYTTIIVESK